MGDVNCAYCDHSGTANFLSSGMSGVSLSLSLGKRDDHRPSFYLEFGPK